MKKFLYLCLSLALVFTVTSTAAAYVETFDANSDSFNYGYGSSFTLGTTNWVSPGGNPGGYISGISSNLYAVWTYTTSPYGDMTGQTMTIDTKITDSETGSAQFYVGRGGSYFVGSAWSISGDSSWTTHTDSTASFTTWTGVNDGVYTLAQILQAPTDIGIFFGGAVLSGTGSFEVDNFGAGAVPIPGAIWLLGSGLFGIVGIRRKFKN